MGVVYVYDVTRRETFEKLEVWRETVQKYMNSQRYTEMVLGNKIDLGHFREMEA
jgi:GTPase SAR1 family protein